MSNFRRAAVEPEVIDLTLESDADEPEANAERSRAATHEAPRPALDPAAARFYTSVTGREPLAFVTARPQTAEAPDPAAATAPNTRVAPPAASAVSQSRAAFSPPGPSSAEIYRDVVSRPRRALKPWMAAGMEKRRPANVEIVERAPHYGRHKPGDTPTVRITERMPPEVHVVEEDEPELQILPDPAPGKQFVRRADSMVRFVERTVPKVEIVEKNDVAARKTVQAEHRHSPDSVVVERSKPVAECVELSESLAPVLEQEEPAVKYVTPYPGPSVGDLMYNQDRKFVRQGIPATRDVNVIEIDSESEDDRDVVAMEISDDESWDGSSPSKKVDEERRMVRYGDVPESLSRDDVRKSTRMFSMVDDELMEISDVDSERSLSMPLEVFPEPAQTNDQTLSTGAKKMKKGRREWPSTMVVPLFTEKPGRSGKSKNSRYFRLGTKEWRCHVCQTGFSRRKSREAHNSSIVHQHSLLLMAFSDSHPAGPSASEPSPAVVASRSVPAGNLGFRMLQQAGWTPGMGLGVQEQGRLEPVEAVYKYDKVGLGAGGKRLVVGRDDIGGSSTAVQLQRDSVTAAKLRADALRKERERQALLHYLKS